MKNNNRQIHDEIDYWASLCEAMHPADYHEEVKYLSDLARLNKKYKSLKIRNEIPQSILNHIGDNLETLIYNDDELSHEYAEYIKDYDPENDEGYEFPDDDM